MEEKINIAMFDFSKEDLKLLENDNYNIHKGSTGNKVNLSYSGLGNRTEYCLSNHHFPKNFHEHDVLAINLLEKNIIDYNWSDHQSEMQNTHKEYKFRLNYPTKLFNPRPYALFLLKKIIAQLTKNTIVIVFAAEYIKVPYNYVKLSEGNEVSNKKHEFSNYDFLKKIEVAQLKNGKKFNIVAKEDFKTFLNEFNDLEYHVTFKKETYWDEDNEITKSHPDFLPLITNSDDEIISYMRTFENLKLFVFPDIKEKGRFTKEFLERITPKFAPQLFNSTSRFSWINDETYLLPEVKNVNNEILLEKEERDKRLDKLEVKLSKKKKKYKFLSDLLTETDEALVDAVFKVLKWIGFEKITKVDSEKEDGFLEEDLLIEYEDKFLVIEIKGIGGTSKDSECSQVTKVRHRRMKEKDTTKVSALYIVNHQRFKPPLARQNPPFNETQIQDAINDDRGLLTTWQLFKLYNAINEGIVTKEQCKEHFFKTGLIDFFDEFTLVGKIDKIYKTGSIGSLKLSNVTIKNNDEVILKKNGSLTKAVVQSIKIKNEVVESANEGRVGISFGFKVDRNTEVLKLNGR